MRYTNWDVLIFPERSKVPLQEFKTACHILRDRESDSHELAGSIFQRNAVVNDEAAHRQLPTVTCFVGDLPTGTSFRVSLHSWELPVASNKAAQIAQMYEGCLYWEARVLIDGVCVAGMLFNDNGPWPQIIDTSSQINKDGEHDDLRWPAFRAEMMTQSWWSAAEDIGRIKVIITEGFFPADVNYPFIRLKNVVTFAFQHAPLNILENSEIAFPSPNMWYQSTQPYYNPPSPTRRGIEDADLHAHSPCRKARPALTDDKTEETEPPAKYLELMPPPPLPRRDQVAMNQGWRSRGPTPDPFIDPHFTSPRYVQIRASSDSSNDQLMPDYSRSITPASSVSSLVRNNRDPMHNAMYEEIIQGFNNNRRDLNSANSGLAPPANTRVSSTVNIPLTVETKSTTTRTRGVSGTYAREPGLVVTTTDDQTPTSENYLRVLEDRNSPDTGEGAPVRISPQPMSEVKSRKMARRASIISLREEDKENVDRGSTKVELIDGKRKRSSTIIGPKTAKPPSRKSSKVDTKDSIETGVLTEASVQQNAVQHAVLAEALNLPETN